MSKSSPLAPVLAPGSRFDESGALVEAKFRLVDPQIAASLFGHPGWKSVRAITMPKAKHPKKERALAELVFANPTMGKLESATMLRSAAIAEWLRGTQRPRTVGVAWLFDLLPHLDAFLDLDKPPKTFVIDNPADPSEKREWNRFWSSKLVKNLEHLEIRFVNINAVLEALRDNEIRRAVLDLDGHELVWTASPPTLTVPPIPLPKGKAARAKAEFNRSYLKQTLDHAPRGIKIATLSE